MIKVVRIGPLMGIRGRRFIRPTVITPTFCRSQGGRIKRRPLYHLFQNSYSSDGKLKFYHVCTSTTLKVSNDT